MSQSPPPGWYVDPGGSGHQRWWDGSRWHAELRPLTGVSPPQEWARPEPEGDVTRPLPSVPSVGPGTGMSGGHTTRAVPPAVAPSPERDPGRHSGWLWALVGAVGLAFVGVGVLVGLWVFADDEVESDLARGGDATAGADDRSEDPDDAVEDPIPDDDDTTADRDEAAAPETNDDGDEPGTSDDRSGTGTNDRGDSADDDDVESSSTPGQLPSEQDAIGGLTGYIDALDAGDLAAAHDHLAPELASRSGWTQPEFTSFWDGRIRGAQVVTVESIGTNRGVLEAVIDYELDGGSTSREQVLAAFIVDETGQVLMSDYEVLEARRR